MNSLKPPSGLSFSGNIAENFAKFKQRFELFMVASGGIEKAKEIQAAILLHTIGDEALEKFNTFNLMEDERKDPGKILEAFGKYCVPKTNESVERHIFFNRCQQIGENIDAYVTDLKKLSTTCNFGQLCDSLIKDRIICGIIEDGVKDKLLNTEDLTLEKCLQICKTAELTKTQLVTMSEKAMGAQVHGIKQVAIGRKRETSNWEKKVQIPGQSKHNNGVEKSVRYCVNCGEDHKPRACPAYNRRCRKCGNLGHYARYCRGKALCEVSERIDEDSDDASFLLGQIVNANYKVIGGINKDWVQPVVVNGKQIWMKLDTGAQVNVLPERVFKGLNVTLEKTKARLHNYNGTEIQVLGRCRATCVIDNKKPMTVTFEVVRTNRMAPAVLGLPSIETFKLLQRIQEVTVVKGSDIFEEYKDLFEGIGEFNYEYKIKLKKNAVPCVEPCRKVPYQLMGPLKEELAKLEKMNIIEKVTEPTEWVSSLVIVKKQDQTLRLCLDPFRLNQNIIREHYALPTFEDLVSRMPQAKIFTILDGFSGFWHIKLHQDSKKLTTFNTLYGRYCFKRMPFGLCSAPEVFHRCFSDIFGGIEGTEVYIDDLIVWGKDEKQHNARLEQVLLRARQENVRFNKLKCHIGLHEVKYIGHKLTEKGISPDDEKIQAIEEIAWPGNRKELETFLGMVTYVAKFIPSFSQVSSPLRELLKKDMIWNWTERQERTFQQIKKELTKEPVLRFFDRQVPIVLSVDASQDGVGAVLLQEGLPVAYASRALTETQRAYAQIEKEMLAILFGCERFHQYLYGTKFVVESDHLPLQSIFKKPLNKCPMRLQRMKIRLQSYTFEVVYKPGRFLLLADALSRAHSKEEYVNEGLNLEAQVGMVLDQLPMSVKRFQQMREETDRDEELVAVRGVMRRGWPQDKSLVPSLAKPYFTYKDELFEFDGLIFKNEQIVIPVILRKEMLGRLHYNHLGIEKCKNRAREHIFWPGMTRQIEDMVSSCITCLSMQRKNTKEPLIPIEVPRKQWEVLGADIYELNGKHYLIVVDYMTKYVEVEKLLDLTSESTIKALKAILARHGIPSTIYSDNGPQFESHRFREFVKQWQFEHKTSSPHYPKANGMVERHIQTVKKMLYKAMMDHKDPYMALLELRVTPISNEIQSPAELMYGRKINGILPTYIPAQEKMECLREQLVERQTKQKNYHDHGAKMLKTFVKGDNVFVETFDKRKAPLTPGRVLSPLHGAPRSYLVATQEGTQLRRNRGHLYRNTEDGYKRNGPREERKYSTRELETKAVQNTAEATPVAEEKREELEDAVTLNKGQEIESTTRSGRVVRKPSYLSDYVGS